MTKISSLDEHKRARQARLNKMSDIMLASVFWHDNEVREYALSIMRKGPFVFKDLLSYSETEFFEIFPTKPEIKKRFKDKVYDLKLSFAPK